MESIDDQARAAGEAKRREVRRKMLEMRSKAPRLYCKAIQLHHVFTGAMPPVPRLARELEAQVLLNRGRALEVLAALECANADGATYSEIIGVLSSMLARHAARRAMDEIEKGMK